MEGKDAAGYFLSEIEGNTINKRDLLDLIMLNPRGCLEKICVNSNERRTILDKVELTLEYTSEEWKNLMEDQSRKEKLDDLKKDINRRMEIKKVKQVDLLGEHDLFKN